MLTAGNLSKILYSRKTRLMMKNLYSCRKEMNLLASPGNLHLFHRTLLNFQSKTMI